jgi:hypothetical protein
LRTSTGPPKIDHWLSTLGGEGIEVVDSASHLNGADKSDSNHGDSPLSTGAPVPKETRRRPSMSHPVAAVSQTQPCIHLCAECLRTQLG